MTPITQCLWYFFPTKVGDDTEHADCDVVRRVQVLVKELFLCQQLFHAEALCIESIKQSLGFLAESDVVRFERSRDGKSSVLCLCSSSTKPVRVLDDLAREINTRRKLRNTLNVQMYQKDSGESAITGIQVQAVIPYIDRMSPSYLSFARFTY